MSVIDTKTDAVTSTIPVGDGPNGVASDLNGIAWHPDTTLLHAAGGAGVYALTYLP